MKLSKVQSDSRAHMLNHYAPLPRSSVLAAEGNIPNSHAQSIQFARCFYRMISFDASDDIRR